MVQETFILVHRLQHLFGRAHECIRKHTPKRPHGAVPGQPLQTKRWNMLLDHTLESGNSDNLWSQELCLAVNAMCHPFWDLDSPSVRASLLISLGAENVGIRCATLLPRIDRRLALTASQLRILSFGARACFHRCTLASWRQNVVRVTCRNAWQLHTELHPFRNVCSWRNFGMLPLNLRKVWPTREKVKVT